MLRQSLDAARHEIDALREALRASQARERLLIHEVQHRVRNMLAVIRSIYRRSRESGASQDEFAEHFQGRLDTVARYQGKLLKVEPAAGVDLEEMILDELLLVHIVEGPGLTINGPPVRLCGKALELMGLVIHELTTNAVKFGALYHQGALNIEWSLAGSPDQQSLRFCWKEASVPLVASAPRPAGFGRQLIEEALPYQLGATTSFDLRPGGIECLISLPLPAGASAGPEADNPPGDGAPLFPAELE